MRYLENFFILELVKFRSYHFIKLLIFIRSEQRNFLCMVENNFEKSVYAILLYGQLVFVFLLFVKKHFDYQ